MITLCTLFNTTYLDKGLTMYESLERHTSDYILYVLTMDDKCFNILQELSLPRFIPIRLADFETEELLKVKQIRTFGEYCWTCSASLVDYIFRTFNPPYCAYIDSDLYFYSDPNCVIEELNRRNASVMITGHRFNWPSRKKMTWKVGRYCVEFNTFKNDKNGRRLLEIWRKQCIDYCKCDGDGIHYADQKYMDNWVSDYDFVVETENLGAGVAPWNFSQYRLVKQSEHGPVVVLCKGRKYKMLFYHFQGITYFDTHTVKTYAMTAWGSKKNLLDSFYIPYLRHISKNKEMLKEKYGIDIMIKHHPGHSHKETENNTDFQLSQNRLYKIAKKICYMRSLSGLIYLLFQDIPTKYYWNQDQVEF